MSYDIRIIQSNDPYGEATSALDVAAVIGALNSFPPFLERGITWTNQKWNDFPAWEGLMIYLEGHDPERIAHGEFDDEAGTCDSCSMHISYGTDSNLESCLDLARRIARTVGATAWDLQLDRPLCALNRNAPRWEWDRIREKFSWLLGRKKW